MRLWILGGVAMVMLTVIAGNARADEPYCREFQRKVTIGGKVQNSYGTACMQPDGDWKIVSEVSDLGEPIQVTQQYIEPQYVQSYVQPQVVYEEPLYVQRQVAYGPVVSGLSFSWSNRDGWGDGRGHREWHGGRGGGWRH